MINFTLFLLLMCDLIVCSTRYADNPNAYWTGYFTSRPALKRYVRMMSGYYLVVLISYVFTMLSCGGLQMSIIHCLSTYVFGKLLILKIQFIFRQPGSWSSLKEKANQVQQQIIQVMLQLLLSIMTLLQEQRSNMSQMIMPRDCQLDIHE